MTTRCLSAGCHSLYGIKSMSTTQNKYAEKRNIILVFREAENKGFRMTTTVCENRRTTSSTGLSSSRSQRQEKEKTCAAMPAIAPRIFLGPQIGLLCSLSTMCHIVLDISLALPHTHSLSLSLCGQYGDNTNTNMNHAGASQTAPAPVIRCGKRSVILLELHCR